jgi:catechol 2,3-dioxygenase-like lactoylglutathione lyase family enzyme
MPKRARPDSTLRKRLKGPREATSAFRVTGIGGVFLRAKNQRRLLLWYKRHLGLRFEEFGGLTFFGHRNPRGRMSGSTTWGLFPQDTDYFGDRRQAAMINYRVEHLDALLARLRRARVRVDPHQETADNGRFAWAYDPEGNRFEQWEPRETERVARSRKTR